MLIQLLTEMNDLDDADVVVIGATNQPEEVDDALRNARRFAEVVEVPPPDAAARRAILAVHLRTPSVPLQDIDLDAAAAATDGFAGDDLEQVVMNAARAALREAEETGAIVPIGLGGGHT
jgi:SpoVK/Ycf46/Vps4 family AAA+-type ATPase